MTCNRLVESLSIALVTRDPGHKLQSDSNTRPIHISHYRQLSKRKKKLGKKQIFLDRNTFNSINIERISQSSFHSPSSGYFITRFTIVNQQMLCVNEMKSIASRWERVRKGWKRMIIHKTLTLSQRRGKFTCRFSLNIIKTTNLKANSDKKSPVGKMVFFSHRLCG